MLSRRLLLPARYTRERAPRPARSASAVLLPLGVDSVRQVRQRLGLLLAGFCFALVVGSVAERPDARWAPLALDGTASGALVALLCGAPLGYCVSLALRGRRALHAAALAGTLLAAVLAMVSAQGEHPLHLLSVPLPALGALAGALGFRAVESRLQARGLVDTSVPVPELPLLGGVYLCLPLLWLSAHAVALEGTRSLPWGLLLLSLYGASLIGSALASRGSAGGGVRSAAAAAAAWCGIGLSPALGAAPRSVAVVLTAAVLFAALHPPVLHGSGTDRRVERSALYRALPLLALHIVASALAPLAASRAADLGSSPVWEAVAGAVPAGGWTAQVAACVVLGYTLAELRGREPAAAVARWGRPSWWIAGMSLAASALRIAATPQPQVAVSTACLTLGTLAGLFAGRAGMEMYSLQRRYARAARAEGAMRAERKLRDRSPMIRLGGRGSAGAPRSTPASRLTPASVPRPV